MGIRALLLSLVLLCTSCATFIDAVVSNSCQTTGTMNFWSGMSPPDEDVMLRALDGELTSDEIEAGATDLLIEGALIGDLPFPGGWGYVQWEGSTEISLFQIPPSEVEPVRVVVPRKVCPREAA